MRVSLLVGAFLAAAAQPGAAGPWPRGEEKTFLAFSYEASVDLEDPFLVPGHEVLLYGEYGLTPRDTLVIDGARHITDDKSTLLVMMSRALAAPGATHQFSVAAGLGSTRDRAGSAGFPVVAASWGRGFDTRWGGGWTTIEFQHRAAGEFRALTKLDATLGLKPSDKSLVFGQIQASQTDGGDPTARLSLVMVTTIAKRFKAELGVFHGILNDERIGVRSGLWVEF